MWGGGGVPGTISISSVMGMSCRGGGGGGGGGVGGHQVCHVTLETCSMHVTLSTYGGGGMAYHDSSQNCQLSVETLC